MKMKKKITLTLLALVCALCCAFGLVACGGEKPDDKTVAVENIALNKTTLTLEIDGTETLTVTVTPDNATDKTVTWSSSAPTIASVDNTGKVTAKAEGTAIITAKTANNKTATCAVTVNAPTPTDQVTAAQWKQILENVNSFTMSVSADSNATVIKRDGFKIMQEMGQQKVILNKDGENYFSYMFDGSKWTKSSITEERYNDMWLPCTMLSFFKDDYNLFTYADGKYTAVSLDKSSTMGGTVQNVVFTFNNSELVNLSFSNSDTTEEMNYEIKNVGTTTVTLPTNFTDNDQTSPTEVTAEQWAQILNSADNYTLTMASDYTTDFKVDDNKVEFDSTEHQIMVKDGVNVDIYTENKETHTWEKMKLTEDYAADVASQIEFFGGLCKLFKESYSSFTYENDKYTADNLNINFPMGGTIKTAEITFENGNLVGIKFSTQEEDITTQYEIKNVGTTTITLPTNFTESNS